MDSDDVHHFLRYGYVAIRRAFNPDTADACREELWKCLECNGIHQSDPTTWVKKCPLGKVFGLTAKGSQSDEADCWQQVFTSRLKSCMASICGEGSARDFGCGWWMITFPGHADGEWKVDGKWHIDGLFRHYPFSKEIGVGSDFFFSVLPDIVVT